MPDIAFISAVSRMSLGGLLLWSVYILSSIYAHECVTSSMHSISLETFPRQTILASMTTRQINSPFEA